MRLGFPARVLTVLTGVLVGVGAASVVVVNARIKREVFTEQAQLLSTADEVFRHASLSRARSHMQRYAPVPNEPRFKAVARLGEPKTIRFTLDEIRSELASDAILYASDAETVVSAEEGLPSGAELESVAAAGIAAAAEGRVTFTLSSSGGRLFDVVGVPVPVGDSLAGGIAFVNEVDEATMLELAKLTGCAVAYYGPDGLLAASDPLLAGAFHVGGAVAPLRVVDGRRYQIREGPVAAGWEDAGLHYAIFSSLEGPLGALRQTQRLLILTSLAGLLLGSFVVWSFIRRSTRPLRALGEHAEAVGRGDFSRRAQEHAHDEFGHLGRAFNRMTENLESSRRELEQTVVQLHQTREQLVQREKLSALGEFVAGVTHELNNPLTAIVGYAELLQSANLPEEPRHDVDAIASGARRCQRIVRSLLSFSRQQKPERQRSNLNVLIDEVRAFMEFELRKGNVRVEAALAPDLADAEVDPHQIQQVLLNIISNARQAMDGRSSQGGVEIRTESSAGRVRVSIRDNGPGIPPDILPRIFDPFFTTKPAGRGTGLGLSLSYGIIQEHGGSISATSTVGVGTTFTIELPALADASTSREPQCATAASERAGPAGPLRILVVDDEPAIRELVATLLDQQGHQVASAEQGAAAWQYLQVQPPDVIVCDLFMPEMGGRALFERVRRERPELAARFIFMTGDMRSLDAQYLSRECGRTVLAKPFASEEFQLAIRSFAGVTA